MRDRLIELINQAKDKTPCSYNPDIDCKGIVCSACENGSIADHLLANGVIVPPCKLGSEIYMLVTRHTKSFAFDNGKMIRRENQHTIVKKTTFTKSNFFNVIEQFGKTVFLTKEEAERALKEREQSGC